MKQVDAPAAVTSPTADAQASDKSSVASEGPASPARLANRATSSEALRRPARMSFKGIAGTAAAPPAAAAAPPANAAAPPSDLMDLLSLDDSAAPVSVESAQTAVSNSDGKPHLCSKLGGSSSPADQKGKQHWQVMHSMPQNASHCAQRVMRWHASQYSCPIHAVLGMMVQQSMKLPSSSVLMTVSPSPKRLSTYWSCCKTGCHALDVCRQVTGRLS